MVDRALAESHSVCLENLAASISVVMIICFSAAFEEDRRFAKNTERAICQS